MQKRTPDPELRQRAEAEVQEKGHAMNLPEQDVRKLCHELEVHQIELELQNEALQDLQVSLQVSEEKYRDLYEFAPIGYYTLDPNGEILETNLAGASLLGRGRARLIGARLQFFLEPEDIDRLNAFIDRAESSDTKEACDVRLKRNGGEPAWVLLEGKSAAEGDGTRIRVAATDITKRKQAERALRESEARFRLLTENASDIVVILDTRGTISYASPSVKQVGGYAPEELTGRSILELTHPDDLPLVMDALSTAAAHPKERVTLEVRIRHISGDWLYLDIIGVNLLEETAVRGIVVNARDVTERKKAEEAMRESEERFRLALKNSPVSVAAQDRDLRYVWAYNQKSARPDQIIGHFDHEIFPAEEAAHFTAIKRRVLEEGIEQREQIWLDRPTGRIYLDIIWEPIRDRDGRIIGVASATVDLTTTKLAEEALRESEEKFRVALRSSPTAVFQQDLNLRYTWVYQPHPHFTPESLLGKRDEDVLDPRDAAPITALKQRALDEQRPLQEDVVIRVNGNPFYYTVSVEPLYDANGSLIGLSGASTDITERKQAEQKILEAVQEKNLILDNTNVAIAFHDAENNFVWANKTYMDYAGVSMSELKGRKCYACWGLDRMCQHCPVILAIKTGEPQEGEVTPENQPHWPANQGSWLVRAAPVRDSEGNIIGAIEVAHDITKRKQAEIALQRRTDDLIRKSEELEAARDEANMYLDIMTHDVRNANNVSSMYADLLVELLAGDQWLYARKLRDAIQRSSEILRNVATIRRASEEPGSLVPVNLDAVIREEIGSFPRASIRYVDPQVEVLADNLMPTIFTNLIGNSVKFGGPDVEITIRVEEQDGEVLVSVEDTGPGVPDEVKVKLFHRFERGMARGSGEGLGLFIVRTLVTRYGGRVWVDDRVPGTTDAGAAFKFTLRAADYSRMKGTGSKAERS